LHSERVLPSIANRVEGTRQAGSSRAKSAVTRSGFETTPRARVQARAAA
jgi:hypothetical protein